MNILALDDFAGQIPEGRRWLGLDLGEKLIGTALSDRSLTIAAPLETIQRRKFSVDVFDIQRLIQKHDVGGLVIGLPMNMNGSEGSSAQSARAFGRNLSAYSPLPITFWDERLSTVAVTRTLLAADASRRQRAKVVDKMAAAYILQSALDRLSYIRGKLG